MTLELNPAHAPFRSANFGQAYNEAAFRYFLDVDRRRLQRSDRSVLLVLVGMREHSGRFSHLTEASAGLLFDGLASCVREVDFVGWYRDDRVIGAVLPQAGSASRELREMIRHRVLKALRKKAPRDLAANLRVRVAALGGKDAR